MHLQSGIFSPADNGVLGKLFLSYAKREREREGGCLVRPAERKRGRATGKQQADTASLRPPLSSPFSSQIVLDLLSGFISEREG